MQISHWNAGITCSLLGVKNPDHQIKSTDLSSKVNQSVIKCSKFDLNQQMMVADGQNMNDIDANIMELPNIPAYGVYHLRSLSHESKNVDVEIVNSESS